MNLNLSRSRSCLRLAYMGFVAESGDDHGYADTEPIFSHSTFQRQALPGVLRLDQNSFFFSVQVGLAGGTLMGFFPTEWASMSSILWIVSRYIRMKTALD